MMERSVSPKAIETRYALDHDDVEPRAAPRRARSDLTPEDLQALGIQALGVEDARALHAPEANGDAASALRDVLTRGGALGKTERRR